MTRSAFILTASCTDTLGIKPEQAARILAFATAHYVNTDLAEGPIIEQGVERVDHSMKPGELERLGQDVESVVLARAVRWHAEHRVFENGHRTVVLRH